MTHIKILKVEPLNHNVRRFVTTKPEGFTYTPGQATEVSIDKDGMREEKRPFTFTSLPDEAQLEFTIKIYPSHDGVTDSLDDLKPGDELIIGDAWGAIKFQGKGTFIAGGAGITPFLAILRDEALKKSDAVQQLIFSNKTQMDLFLTKELSACANQKILLTFTEEEVSGAEHGRVDAEFMKTHIQDFDQKFYVCGPPAMVDSVTNDLKTLGASPENIITEEA